jgi:signal transduction histidine kinase
VKLLKRTGGNPLLVKPKRYTTIVMALIVLVGLAGSLLAGYSVRQQARDSLMSRAQTAADALNVKETKSLKGDKSDLNNNAYLDIKRRITKIRDDNPDIRFVYLLGRRGQDIYFMVDSEATNSSAYSPPGQIYPEASTNLKGAFITNDSFIEGPLRDNYGYWLSGLVSIVDPSTGNTVAVLGLDLPAQNYYLQILLYSLIPLLLAAIPLAGLQRDRKLEVKEREIGRLKTQFVSVASHELRSPLAGTLWAVQTFIKPGTNTNLNEHQKGLLNDIYSSTASSLATVNEILDFSIFDRDESMKLQHETIDIIPVLKEAQKLLKLSAEESRVHITFTGKWPTLVETVGDVAALKRAFTNIMSNAIKYSRPNTKVELVYHFQNGQHIVAVRDHGIGIPKKEQGRVLEGYYRATNASKIQSRGTGLGLWITRLIIERHNGRLWLKSKEDEGTIIFVALPSAVLISNPK